MGRAPLSLSAVFFLEYLWDDNFSAWQMKRPSKY